MRKINVLTAVVIAVILSATGCRKMDLESMASVATTSVSSEKVMEGPSLNLDTCSILEDASKTATAKMAMRQQPATNTATTVVTLLVDFDGQANVDGAPWGIPGTFNCPSSGIPSSKIDSMMKMNVEDYSPFRVVVTKSEQDFQCAPYPKTRIIVTKKNAAILASPILGSVPGAAYISSILWNDDTPSFVFVNEFTGADRFKKIAEAISHELGHTFGLYHQSEGECGVGGEYKYPSGDLENGAIEGNSYQVRFSRWIIGPSRSLPCGQLQNDAEVIASVAGYNEESFSSTFDNDTKVLNSTAINAVLVHTENQHAFRKNGNSTKTLSVISKGNINAKVAVYSSPTAVPVIYDDPNSGNVVINISGKKLIRVYTTQPDNFPPSPVGGGYSIKLQ